MTSQWIPTLKRGNSVICKNGVFWACPSQKKESRSQTKSLLKGGRLCIGLLFLVCGSVYGTVYLHSPVSRLFQVAAPRAIATVHFSVVPHTRITHVTTVHRTVQNGKTLHMQPHSGLGMTVHGSVGSGAALMAMQAPVQDQRVQSLSGSRWQTVRSGEGDIIAGIGQSGRGNAAVQQTIKGETDLGLDELLQASRVGGGPMSIDREMADAISDEIFNSPTIAAPKDSLIMEGDMIWRISQLHSIQNDLRGQKDSRRPEFNPSSITLWPKGIVPIRISSGGFTRGQKREMQAAMNRISRDTCVCFRIITRAEAARGEPHIRIRNRRRCASFIGRNIRRSKNQRFQDLLMAPKCRTTRIFTHQLLHALGLYHEHTAPNRNSNVRILYSNISPYFWYHLNRIPWNRYSSLERETPYDYLSIMHYGPTAFSQNGRITIRPKRNVKRNIARIGRSSVMSSLDKSRIRQMYNCPRKPPARPTCPQYPYRFE
ncbi:high choriolytic enzyme 2-like [Argopecten irradians]|uniref:high choriolytic enzyme 2-like n=1 Tax=Argopecten irradians TaxID=31199 RepID=UPI00371F49BF